MSELQDMTYEEKVFLAGSMKMALLADGILEENELNDLDKICGRLQFDDFEECLEVFEKTAKDQEGFFSMAEKIRNPKVQNMTLKLIDELILQGGNTDKSQRSIFEQLQKIWE